ncbi:uncharacterized protein Z519_04726 [Cladophialophora bantiana CBS 173.52]|uniref:ABC a-pheromone efflux pump AtrD n=1 Tax=Cladophialophora bantiana (strain ATCC 10958 / CBS 173.52 / CDC B-1940 / NIH 8579) TaxID=1442370 RepID=A0A0D2IDC2_CLAB1|nr:uncharacterized protein Z519_04726 [Cladophialophora bantiana CBS 173.52]KIW94749.1 hypothetical protein Z519_04726 [Cladophialophora bantiana CBS 173.52]
MTTSAQDEHQTESNEAQQKHGVLGRWKSVFTFTAKAHLPILLGAIIFSAAAGCLQPTMAFFFGKFFDTFSDFAAGKTDGSTFMERSLSSLYVLFGIGGATFVLKGTLFSLWLVFGEMQARSIRELLFQSLLDRGMEWYEARTTGVGTLLSRVRRQIRELQLGASQPLGFIIVCLVQAVAGLGLAIHTNWKLTLVVLSAIPVIAIGSTLIARRVQANIDHQNAKLTTATKTANNCVTNIVTVKCFNTQDQEGNNYSAAVKEAGVFSLKQALSSSLQTGFVRFWYGGTQVHSGTTSAGKVVTTFWACLIATKAFEDMLPHCIVLQRSQSSAVALKAVMDKVMNGKTHSRKVDGLSPQYCEGDIEIQGVSFAYPSRPDSLVLDRCTFYFPAGETTFIVGRSGCGKSTLSHILMRFYDPRSGAIFIDDNALQDIDTNWLRNNITLVQQKCVLFSDTIFRNIALGRRDFDRVTEAQVNECMRMAALERTIELLPEGVHTRVGTGGSSLSGGQKQRIAIARARLRNTPILILDEATSALDNSSKSTVMRSIREWRRGKTTVVITHDMTQIQDDDFVYVLDRGRVIQEGRLGSLVDFQNPAMDQQAYAKRPTIKHLNCSDDPAHSLSRCGIGDPAQPAIPFSLFRKDSFDFGAVESARGRPLENVQDSRQGAQMKHRLRKDLSASRGAALKLLKRQSMARAKAMYPLYQIQPSVHQSTNLTSATYTNGDSIVRQSIFVSAISRTPKTRDKPLPVPPLRYNVLGENKDPDRDATDVISTERVSRQLQPAGSILAVFTTLWPSLDSSNRTKLLLGFLATLAHAGAPPTFSYALVQVFDTYYLPTGSEKKALIYSMVVVGIAVADGLACFFMQYLLGSASQAWVDTLRIQALRRILRQPKAWFDKECNNPGTLISSLDRNAEEVKDLVERFAAQLLVVAVMMAVAIIWSLFSCWKITLVSLAASPVLYVMTKCFGKVSSLWESRSSSASDGVNEIFVETFADIKTVRSLTLESYFHKKYCDATSQTFSIGVRRALFCGFFFGVSDSAITFFTPMIFWYGAHLAKDSEWPVNSIFTVFGLLLFCTANASVVITYIPQTRSATDIATRLIRLAQMQLDSHEDVGLTRLDRDDPATLSGPIHFINLTFFYPTRPEVAALRRLNLTIPSGQTTAIVGASGSGKSTITSLLLGLYPPTADPFALSPSTHWEGGPASLTLSGRDIRTLDLPSLRSLIAIVPQTPVLLPATVRENIAYGLPPDSPWRSASRIERAARATGIHDFIQSLPQGYATVIGEGGGGLGISGGQAQRIVIARALIRDPKILILDEATSALDRESAQVIRESIARLSREKGRKLTVIVVTHAREMMEVADHVVVMEEGGVIEQGSFTELVEKRRKFWALLNAGDDGASHTREAGEDRT